MPVRKGFAVWEGPFREGKGSVKVESGLFEGSYSAGSRFESGLGTNPRGAHRRRPCRLLLHGPGPGAGSLKKTPPKRIETTAEVTIEPVGQGFKITSSALHTVADVPGISEEDFIKAAADAKANCPVSQALAGVKISLDAKLKK